MSEIFDFNSVLLGAMSVSSAQRNRLRSALNLADNVATPYRQYVHKSNWGLALKQAVDRENEARHEVVAASVVEDTPQLKEVMALYEAKEKERERKEAERIAKIAADAEREKKAKEEAEALAAKEAQEKLEQERVENEKRAKQEVAKAMFDNEGVLHVEFDKDVDTTFTVNLNNNFSSKIKAEYKFTGGGTKQVVVCRLTVEGYDTVIQANALSKKLALATAAKHFLANHDKMGTVVKVATNRGMCDVCGFYVNLDGHELRCETAKKKGPSADPLLAILGDTVYRLVLIAVYESVYKGKLDFTRFAIPYECKVTQAILYKLLVCAGYAEDVVRSEHTLADRLEVLLITDANVYDYVTKMVLFLLYLSDRYEEKPDNFTVDFVKLRYSAFWDNYNG